MTKISNTYHRALHLVVMGDDRRHLSAGQGDVLARQVVHGPGSWVQGMVKGVFTTVAPVPTLKCWGMFCRQHLLVYCLTPSAQTYCKLGEREVQIRLKLEE